MPDHRGDSIPEILERLRLRLLDLTARNRLLNFKPSSTKSLQIVEAVPNAVYDRLLDGKSCTIIPVPDPLPIEYLLRDGRRVKPEIREFAKQRGIDINYELPQWRENVPATGSEGNRLRAIFYPEDLERQCRRITREAQSAIQETGNNMLYLVFGFLEFYESDDADRPLNSPLLAVPVILKRGSVDPQTSLYRYDLSYTGEEITGNLSLREKLKQEFGIQLPELGEEERPEAYIEKIKKVITRKHRWKVKRQMTLGLLSFAKMMLVRDIDPANWPMGKNNSVLIEHPTIQRVFLGSGDGGGQDQDHYAVDDLRENGPSLELIYDADASQHSALIDSLAGKDLVIIGPPGTGKSQTITNLIALAIMRGKKVLFVAEKLAALEVVKNRLDQAGLGDFCLELHSHKTDKKWVVEQIRERQARRYVAPRGLDEKLESLDRQRKRLKKYADLMNSTFGNELNLSVFDIFWKAESHRKRAAPLMSDLEDLVIEEAPLVNGVRLNEMRQAIEDLSRHFQEVELFGPQHPWFGFFPTSLNPGEDLFIRSLLSRLEEDVRKFDRAMAELQQEAHFAVSSENSALESFVQSIESLREPGPQIITELLPRLFPSEDPCGLRCHSLVETCQKLCDETKALEIAIQGKLINPEAINEATLDTVRSDLGSLRKHRVSECILRDLKKIVSIGRTVVEGAKTAFDFFKEIAELIGQPFGGTKASIHCLLDLTAFARQTPHELLSHRHPGLNYPSARDVLATAREQFSALSEQREMLERLFWFDDQPEGAELLRAIRALRQGDAWYRIFQSEWRWACRLHKTLSRDKDIPKTGTDRLEELTDLAKYRKEMGQFQKNEEFIETFGALFHGIETDFEKLEKLVDWYDRGRDVLLRHALAPLEFDLTTIDGNRLVQLALRHESIQTHMETMRAAEEYCSTSIRGTSVFEVAGDDRRPWFERLNALERFLDTIEAPLFRVCALGQSELNADQVFEAIDARCRYIVLRERIQSQSAIREVLGEYFEGLDTNFPFISETLAWGMGIARANLPEATKAMLLTDQACGRLTVLKQVCCAARATAGFAQRFAESMRHYGPFNWDQWNSMLGPVDSQGSTGVIRQRAAIAIENMGALLPWTQYNRARKEVARLGLKGFANRLEAGSISRDKLEDTFLYRFYTSVALSIFGTRTELAKFSGMSHEGVRREFSALDKEVIALRGKACAAHIARNAAPPPGIASARIDEKTEMALLSHLMTLQRPRTPIRQVIRRASRAVRSLKPCFMMSPLSVAQYLEPGAVEFDLVVMDEASQLKVEEALGAIARGKQLVVVGDPKQLPPTSFFDRMMTADDEEDEGTPVSASESILDMCSPIFSNRTLRWHYRSKHESLIAFSNHHFYSGQLIVFPSPYPKTKRLGLWFHFVKDAVYQNRQNHREAERVVDEVLFHMKRHPEESLGVVTLNITQRDLIEDILTERLRSFEEGESYKARWEKDGWPFFVKNLENVQGDERDVIFISTTFGRVAGTSAVRQNFGPISRAAGWRRLNVLFTRARKSLQVFSSMQPEDIIVDDSTPEGTKALRNYLEYAARGVLLGPDFPDREPDSDFEMVVADVLRNRGYEVQPQLGVAGYFIDLAVRNPDLRGEFLAAIECDGATYHSGASVRDRDRIRQDILESQGWKEKIWRIWSPDWFRNSQNETRRLLEFLAARRKAAAEQSAAHAEEDFEDEKDGEDVGRPVPAQLELQVMQVDEDEELYIEVGDTVTYCDVESPSERKSVLITDGASIFEQGIINAATPLARTLLDKTEGEEVDLRLPGREPRRFRILQIDRSNRRR